MLFFSSHFLLVCLYTLLFLSLATEKGDEKKENGMLRDEEAGIE